MKIKTSLFLCLLALAAVVLLGAPLTALAAHPDVVVKDSAGATAGATTPYSPKMTCGGCHFNCATSAYSDIKSTWCGTLSNGAQKDCSTAGNCPDYASAVTSGTSHAQGYTIAAGTISFQSYTVTSPVHGASIGFHSQHGRNEELTSAQRTIWGAPAFISSPGMFGRYCMPSNRQLSPMNLDAGQEANQVEMSPANFAKSCGVCHAGGGQMEYDRTMNSYGASSPSGDRFTWLIPTVTGAGHTAVAGGLVDIAATPSVQSSQLYGGNKAEVDCLMCHMSAMATGAAYYKNTLGCTNLPSDVTAAACNTGSDPRFAFTAGGIYDSFNRNIAVSYGHFQAAASAGIGAGVNLSSGAVSGVPASILGANIALPKSANCGQCHARNEADNIGLPNEAMSQGGMIAGYGNFIRVTAAGNAFDWDKIAADGSCTGDCSNSTTWYEFGCKTGMGKRSQKTGAGSADRFDAGFCLVCDMYSQWSNPMSFCALPSIQASCIAKSGIPTLVSDNNPYSLIDGTGRPMKIPGKMPDVDVHDKTTLEHNSGTMTCASCHYKIAGTVPSRTVTNGSAVYTYPTTSFVKMDHQMAKGYSMLEKAGDGFEGTVSCAGCHTTRTHPNLVENGGTLVSPTPSHAGFPALHIDKIDCRTCHIPYIYAKPGRLLFRDWTAGAYRQTEGSNGNANHFEFAMNMLEGSMAPIRTFPMWITTPEGTKITPMQTNFLPIWSGSMQNTSDSRVSWVPAKTRDITAAAARIAAANPGLGIRINGTNDHPPFQGFNLADPLKIESKQKIDLMAAELNTTGGGIAAHGTVRDARINLYPLFYDTSHGVVDKEFALGAAAHGGCIMCHSSSAVNPMTGQPMDPASYSPRSVGFFDGNKEMLQNGMMQMANYDCDNPYLFTLMTTGQTTTLASPTCDVVFTNDPMWGGDGACDGTQPGTNPNTGAANGTLGLCKQMVGAGLAGQMGVTPDPMLRMDGVEFMQMFAIREGQVAAGCNPMMRIFGLPTGCAADGHQMYTRNEIKLHFAKSMQQSFFTPVMAGQTMTDGTTVPATMGRVYGVSAQIGKNPGNPAHVNKFDFGSTCRNPLDGSTFPCSEAMPGMTNLINTAINANQILGYSPAYVQYLKSFMVSATPVAEPTKPLARIAFRVNGNTVTVDGRDSLRTNSYSWSWGDNTVSATTATASHTYATSGTYNMTLTVTNSSSGISDAKTVSVIAAATYTDPTSLTATATVADSLVTTVTYTATDLYDTTLRTFTNWGDGTTSTTGLQALSSSVTHTYETRGIYNITHSVINSKGYTMSVGIKNVAVPRRYTISGTVIDNGVALPGAVVALKPNDNLDISTAVTGTDGSYTISLVSAGTYTAHAAMANHNFTADQAVTVGPSRTGINFTALHQVRGSIPGIGSGTLVTLTSTLGAAGAAFTDAASNYYINNLVSSGTYTVTPTQPAAPAFITPAFQLITVGTSDIISSFTYSAGH